MITEPKIIFEDSDLIVIDKPSGLTVNKSDTTVGETTVQDWIDDKFKIQNSLASPSEAGRAKFKIDSESDFFKRSGIVHRLDKETSGILLVAKNSESFYELQRQFKERLVSKTYLALVRGAIKVPQGQIQVPVGRLPWNRKRFGVMAMGKEAMTEYKVLGIKYYGDDKKREPLTLLELYPKTGRTHQIRVHLKYFGHPIFADSLYAGRKTARNDRKILPRVFLHASKISFFHPKTNKTLSFESNLPGELVKFLNLLQN